MNGALKTFGSGETPAQPGFKGTLVPGDYTYFNNWQVAPEWAAMGARGENVFYLGDGKYYGHGMGIVTEQEVAGDRTAPASKVPRKTLRWPGSNGSSTPSFCVREPGKFVLACATL